MASPTQRIHRDALLDAMRARYDHASAGTMLDAALRAAGLPLCPEAGWDPTEISRLVWALHQLGERAQPAATALMGLASVAAAPTGPAQDEGEDEIAIMQAELPGLIAQVVEAAVASVRERRRSLSTLPPDDEPS